MYLKLAIAGNVIASVPLNSKEATNLEYIYAKRCLLAEACCTAFADEQEQPVYFIEVSSKMNTSVRR
jgi:hypothetical protein